MDIVSFFQHASQNLDQDQARSLAQSWHVAAVKRGSTISMQGEPSTQELIILDGRAVGQIISDDGHEVCVGLYDSPTVVTPHIARSKDGLALASIVATRDGLVASMPSDALTQMMLSSVPVRDWANAVLQHELAHKAEREWALAALPGRKRLSWFRQAYPGFEDKFSHGLIASFLGITPVTFSRLRSAEK